MDFAADSRENDIALSIDSVDDKVVNNIIFATPPDRHQLQSEDFLPISKK
jgi:hypothetical protein